MAGATADADGLPSLRPFQNHPVPVLARAQQFIAAHLRRIGQRAPHQEQIQETRSHRVHADWRERVDIQRTHFDVFDAAAQQRVRRRLAALGHALRPDRRIQLVLDLQHVAIQLQVAIALFTPSLANSSEGVAIARFRPAT